MTLTLEEGLLGTVSGSHGGRQQEKLAQISNIVINSGVVRSPKAKYHIFLITEREKHVQSSSLLVVTVVYWSYWRAWSVSKAHKVMFSKYWTDQTDLRKLASAAQDIDGFLWLSWRVGCLTGLESKEVGSQVKDNPCHVLQVTPEWR